MNEPAPLSEETKASLGEEQAPIHSEPRAPWASAIALAEAGLLTDVSIVFDLAWIYVPVLGMAFVPLIPTPFAILYLRRGLRISLFAGCVAGFLMTVLVGPHYGWRLTLEAILGIAIGWTMERRWSPYFSIGLALFINATVAYVAAFGAVFALGLPLHDLYLELRNLLLSVRWTVDTAASIVGVQREWLGVRPWFATIGRFSLAYWVPMFYAYTAAIAAPIVVLYYSVASTAAFALGHDVKPFPPSWAWRALRGLGLVMSPLFWLVRMAWALVTIPLWGPVWLVRAMSRWRRARRLRGELATLPVVAPAVETPMRHAAAGDSHTADGAVTSALDGKDADVLAAPQETARES